MTRNDARMLKIAGISLLILLVTLTANALIDLGAVIHDLTHPH